MTYITTTLTAGTALRTEAQTAFNQANQRLIDIAGGDYYGARTALTIASDAITLVSGAGFYVLTSQTGVTDNLNTVSGGSASRVVVLVAASGHTITLTGGGNITSPSGWVIQVTATQPVALIWDSSTWKVVSSAPQRDAYIHLRHISTSGTGGGTFTSGAWQARSINQEVSDVGGFCSVSTPQFTLQAGTYRISVSAAAFAVGNHLIRLWDTNLGAMTLPGVAAVSVAGSQTHSTLAGTFTIPVARAFELQHRCDATVASNGFGIDLGSWLGGNNTHCDIELWRQAGS